jgi:RNA polymerase sigma factor (sigma-70 family)
LTLNKRQRIAEENALLLHLWYQAQAGDSVAFCQLAEKQYRTLFNYATSFTSDREFIKDAIQELMIHIWEKRESIQIQFVTIYFLRALRNQLMQEFRRNNPAMIDIDEATQISDFQTIETEMERHEVFVENQTRVRSAVNELPRRQKEAIFLKYFEGMDNEQIADLMQVNRQSVANLLFKAITTLKSHMQAIGAGFVTLLLLVR